MNSLAVDDGKISGNGDDEKTIDEDVVVGDNDWVVSDGEVVGDGVGESDGDGKGIGEGDADSDEDVVIVVFSVAADVTNTDDGVVLGRPGW